MSMGTQLARWLGFGMNPLRRPVDRIDSLLLGITLLAAVAFTVGAILLGFALTQYEIKESHEQLASRSTTNALLLSNPTPWGIMTGSADSSALAQWTDKTGNQHVDTIDTTVGLKPGASVVIWIDQAGKVVRAPLGFADAITCAITLALVAWLTAESLLVGLFWLLRWPLDRWRDKAWEQEWKQVSLKWQQGMV